jgi:ATP-binding cassette subfamily A (ABC1) protein 3
MELVRCFFLNPSSLIDFFPGKSTLVNVLAGLYQADDGQAHIFGHSLSNSLDQVRSHLGVCPQDNTMLFDRMTAREHIELYLACKGVKMTRDEVSDLLNEFCLESSDHDRYVEKLSGGNKRKRCIFPFLSSTLF